MPLSRRTETEFGELPALTAPEDHVARLRRTLQERRGVVTLGDAMAGTGLAQEEAEAALKVMLASYSGHVDVTDAGDLVYRFDPRLLARDHRPLLARAWDGVKAGLTVALKVGIMVTLIGYSVLFTVIGVAALVALSQGNNRDNVDSDVFLELLVLPFRAFAEFLFFFPEWFFWGTGRRIARREKKPALHERVFAFVFGPPRAADAPADRDRLWATRIRERRGVLTTLDAARHLGEPRFTADELLGRLLGRFGGDARPTETGEVLYLFPEITTSAAPAHRAGRAAATVPLEPRPLLTGNTTGSNALIAALSAITLVGSGAIGTVLFPVLGLGSTALEFALVYIPGAVGLAMFAVPGYRALRLAGERRAVARRNIRRLLLEAATAAARMGGPVTTAELRDAVRRRLPKDAGLDERLFRDVLRELAAEFEAELVEGRSAEPAYRFDELARLEQAAEAARESLGLERTAGGPLVFSTEDTPEQEARRDAAAWDREIGKPRSSFE
ncbi:MAG TPA: hypothetical protein VFQ38_11240 [Longimicrobiales bacterium]|nr:hypothetical protein [Longimicrobiales bacterium]